MAVPAAYADLGKSARDILTKGYGNILYFVSFFKTVK